MNSLPKVMTIVFIAIELIPTVAADMFYGKKKGPKNVVYFGGCKRFNRVFKGYLFQVSANDLLGIFAVTARNVVKGEEKKFNWFGKKARYCVINGYGRFFCQDTVKGVSVQDGKLIFEVSRVKSNDPLNKSEEIDEFDIDTMYKLVVEYIDKKFKAKAVFSLPKKTCEDKAPNLNMVNTPTLHLTVCRMIVTTKDTVAKPSVCGGRFVADEIDNVLNLYAKEGWEYIDSVISNKESGCSALLILFFRRKEN